jgi:hypothetical protein
VKLKGGGGGGNGEKLLKLEKIFKIGKKVRNLFRKSIKIFNKIELTV